MACACHHHHVSTSGRPASASAPAPAALGLPSLALAARRPAAAALPPRPRSAPLLRAASAAAAPTNAASAAALGAFAALPVQQKQQQQAPTTATTEARGFLPTATITRIFLTGTSPGGALRSALGGAANRGNRSAAHGPLSLLLVLLALAAAALAAVRNAVVRRVRGCNTCRGFGVSRCRLCQGSGRVDWTAKLSHYDVCPLCMNRRFVSCADCGGVHGARPLFAHLRRRAGGELFEGVPRPADEAAANAPAPALSSAPLVSAQGTKGPVLAFGGAGFALGSLTSMDGGDESDGVARQPTGAASSRRRAQQIRDVAGGAAAFAVPADAAAPAGGVGSAMMD